MMLDMVSGRNRTLKMSNQDPDPDTESMMLPDSENDGESSTIDDVRDSRDPIKLRVQRRAGELGKTLLQVYREAGVNKNFLSEIPKTGRRQDKLHRIAEALEWTIDQLIDGVEEVVLPPPPKPKPKPKKSVDLLEYAIEVAVDVYSSIYERPPAAQTAWLARQLYKLLEEGQPADGGPQPDRQWFLSVGRLLAASINDVSKT